VVSTQTALARCEVRGGTVVPRWFGERDHPRIADVIETYAAFVGATRRELEAHLGATLHRLGLRGARLVAAVLDERFRAGVDAAVAPPRARMAAFEAAAACRGSPVHGGDELRGRALQRAAAELDVEPPELERSLFADLPGERRLQAPAAPVTTTAVAERCNLAIAQAALARSSRVRVELEGHARAVVRHALLRGLICTATRSAERTTLAISGPLALFRRTRLYGRHLAELVPILAWARGFRLEADCVVHDRPGRLTLDPTAPLPPSAEPRRYDSRLERRFARDFVRLGSAWDVVREPEPLAVEGTLIFPDFALVHRADPSRRFLVEILGFWTADYVATKLRRLRAAGAPNLILCIDAGRDCGGEDLPSDAAVLWFEKRVDAAAVLAVVEGRRPGAPAARPP
jgi:hypothetical protein